MVTYHNLQTDLLQALDLHIDILKEVDDIEREELPGFLFMMRSLGFMLDRAALVLASVLYDVPILQPTERIEIQSSYELSPREDPRRTPD